jgi:N-acetylmuramoyl-L-alanine amidase
MLKNIKVRLLALLCSCLLAAAPAMAANTIDAVRLDRQQERTRLVLSVKAPARYSVTRMSNPERLVVDVRDARLRYDLSKLALQDSPIKRVRSGVRNGTDARLVLELNAAVKTQSATLSGDGQGNRLVIDIYPRTNKTAKASKTEKKTAVAVARAEPDAVVASPAKPLKVADGAGRRDVIIAIDAGHGGDDPGAIGPGRLEEKRVALAIAKELAAIVERERGYKAVLTRNGDYFLPLKTRRDLARKAQADLMISVHADAFSDRDAQGGSVFALSDRGATSTMAAFLAASENEADAIGGVSTEGKDDDLVKVLADLSLTATMESSLRIGRHVLNSMGGVTRLHTNRVEQAAFVVLKSPDTPSILVETGFVSNPQEARRLASHDYQEQIARAVFNGVNRYFSQNPPPNTYLAWVKRNGKPPAAADSLASVEP